MAGRFLGEPRPYPSPSPGECVQVATEAQLWEAASERLACAYESLLVVQEEYYEAVRRESEAFTNLQKRRDGVKASTMFDGAKVNRTTRD